MSQHLEPEIIISGIGGNFPVQAEGTIDGESFYFRARGNSWTLAIGVNPVGRIDASDGAHWCYRELYGNGPFAAGCMSPEEARGFIEKAAHLYVNREL
ncbi:hypothetical protein UFOVP28_80 [uncultured Caudovirales phage]|uniref:Uncharacterized protein n=1 Tax=uncultured Caudovirales phage TaxID=2100421 RepID=A0A6J5KPU9_9CAUD|nr:hypothetical protein UFOVP28_80 [uncultured Caudovirales phage]